MQTAWQWNPGRTGLFGVYVINQCDYSEIKVLVCLACFT